MFSDGAWVAKKFGWYSSSLHPLQAGSHAACESEQVGVAPGAGAHDGGVGGSAAASCATSRSSGSDMRPWLSVTTRSGFVVPGASGTSTQNEPSGNTSPTALVAPPPWMTTVVAPGAEPRTGAVSSGVCAGTVAEGAARLPAGGPPVPGNVPPPSAAEGIAGCSALQPEANEPANAAAAAIRATTTAIANFEIAA